MITDTPITDVPRTLLEDILTALEFHSPTMGLPARERAAKAFVRSIGWMEDNPAAWEIRHVEPIHFIDQLDKPHKLVVRGRVVDVFKAHTIDHSKPLL